MSGPLLLGIAAVGVGWAWCTRGKETTPAVAETKEAAGAVAPADGAVVGAEVPVRTVGLAAVKDAVDGESKAPTLGDIPISGSDGGQVLPVVFDSPEGGIKIPPNQSTGGADPATQQTAIHSDETPPVIAQGDTSNTILQALYGAGCGSGMTGQQIGNAIRDSAVWSGEVF